MTRSLLSLRPMAASLVLLAACAAPSVDPGADAGTDTDPSAGSTGSPDPDDETGAGPDESTGAASTDPLTSGPDPDDDGSTGDLETSGGEDGPAPTCDPATHTCLSATPAEWSGPVALLEADADGPPLPCGAPYPEFLDLELAAGFSPGDAAACACDCNPSNDAECHVDASLSYWDLAFGLSEEDACGMIPDGTIVLDEGPTINNNPAWVDDPTGVWRVNSSTQTIGGSCVANGAQNIPEPGFDTRITACGMHDEPATCDGDGVCAPKPVAPLEGQVCIWQEGEHACPEGDYVEQRILHGGIEDTRSCLECACGDLQGSCTAESFTVGFYSFAAGLFNIAWDEEQIPLDGSCELIALQQGQTHNAMDVVAGDLQGASCTADPGTNTVQGDVAPIDPVTFCCLQM